MGQSEYAPGDAVWVVDTIGVYRAMLIEQRGERVEVWTVRGCESEIIGRRGVVDSVTTDRIFMTREAAAKACMKRAETWLMSARMLMEEAPQPEQAEPTDSILIVRIHEPAGVLQ